MYTAEHYLITAERKNPPSLNQTSKAYLTITYNTITINPFKLKVSVLDTSITDAIFSTV
jgi:hypothetical protein